MGERCPQAVHQRDLFGVMLTESAQKKTKINAQIPCWIGAKMTPVLQLTDTDFAFLAKNAAEWKKREMTKKMRERAQLKGEIPDYHMGHEEILEIVNAAHERMETDNAAKDIVVKAARRNGMLVFRPDWKEGRMVDVENDERFKDAPLGSHRLQTDWLRGRKHWRDADGKPWPALWEKAEQVKKMEDLAEADYCGKMFKDMNDHHVLIGGQKIPVHVTDVTGEDEPGVKWDQSLFTDADALAQLHPKMRRLIAAEMDSHSDMTKFKSRGTSQKKAEAERLKAALKTMDEDFDRWCTEMLLDHPRDVVPKNDPCQGKQEASKEDESER